MERVNPVRLAVDSVAITMVYTRISFAFVPTEGIQQTVMTRVLSFTKFYSICLYSKHIYSLLASCT